MRASGDVDDGGLAVGRAGDLDPIEVPGHLRVADVRGDDPEGAVGAEHGLKEKDHDNGEVHVATTVNVVP